MGATCAVVSIVLLAGSAVAAAPTWGDQALPWSLAGATSSYLLSASCSSATCVAVGYATTGPNTALPVIEVRGPLGWSEVPESLPPGTFSLDWHGVSCASTCVAVGVAIMATGAELFAARGSGSAWTVTPLPVQTTWGDYPDLAGISCAGVDCTAVGEAQGSPILESFDGTTWTPYTLNAPAGSQSASLDEVSCPDAQDCTAMGFDEDASSTTAPLVAQETAGSWTLVDASEPAGTTVSQLDGISCWADGACAGAAFSASDDALVLGVSGTTVAYGDLPLPAGVTTLLPTAISCLGAMSCLLTSRTGVDSGNLGYVSTLAGTTWTSTLLPVPSGDDTGFPAGVSCASATSCEIVGTAGVEGDAESYVAYGAKFDGSKWALDDPNVLGPPSAELYATACPSSGTCVAVGMYEDAAGADESFVDALSGGAWRVSLPRAPAGAMAAGLFGVSCPKPSVCVAVGEFVTADGSDEPYADLLSHGSWHATAVPMKKGWVAAGLDAVACTSSTRCIAVGDLAQRTSTDPWCTSDCSQAPLVDRLDGSAWSSSIPPTPKAAVDPVLDAVSCWATLHCVAVGTYFRDKNFFGAVEALNGAKWQWSSAAPPAGGSWAELLGVSCTSATACHLVGDYEVGGGESQLPLAELGAAGGPWTPSAPTGTSVSMWGDFGAIECYARTCTAVGTNGTDALVGTLTGHLWAVQVLALPAGEAGVALNGVGCLASGWCRAVGAAFSPEGTVPATAGPRAG